jgi:hypothetical protein
LPTVNLFFRKFEILTDSLNPVLFNPMQGSELKK